MDYSNCRELFLEGITDVFVYPSAGSVIPIPFVVAHIESMEGCSFPDALLHVALSGEDCLVADKITAKMTMALTANGDVYTYSISMDVANGTDNFAELRKSLSGNDCPVVFRLADGTYRLCHTIPGTFSFLTNVIKTESGSQRTIDLSVQSRSEFIAVKMTE